MKLIRTNREIQIIRERLHEEGKKVGFVPTMGSLHNGHLSLVETAQEQSDALIVSIFVNPTQFNDPEDFKNYPVDLDRDLHLLKPYLKIAAVFIPGVKEMYPEPDERIFDFGYLDKVMEGAHRPGHFNGVAQIVSKLFDLIRPHKAFFGQKDFQQLIIIRELVKQLKMNIEIISCPIIRESDGLAMSSRNVLLGPEERTHAPNIFRVLSEAKDKARQMRVEELKKWVVKKMNNDPCLSVEYFDIVDFLSLKPVINWEQPGEKVGCVAVKIGKIRLIDNIIFP